MANMHKREVKIGLSVIIAIAILVVGINYLKGINLFKASNYYYATFNNVCGLALSAPVNLNGYQVGLVRSIDYDYEHPGNVIVEMSVDKNLHLPLGTKAMVSSDILGTATITLQMGASTTMHQVGDSLIGVTEPGMLDAVSEKLMPAVSEIFPKIDSLLTSVNALVSDPAVKNSVQRLDGITADLKVASANLSLMAQQLAPLPGQVNPILTDVKTITGNVCDITNDVKGLSGQLNQVQLDSLLNNIEIICNNLKELSAQLNDPNSSFGKLTNDPALYDNINNAVRSLDSIFVDVKRNPKRYINIKVF